MSHAAPGRHRSPAPARPQWRVPILGTAVAILTVAIASALILWWPADPNPPEQTTSDRPSPSVSTPDPSTSTTGATVESTSVVTVDGKTIVVEEVSSVTAGGTARAVPSQLTPLGLELLDASVITPDGRSSSFDAPVTISANGSLTVRNRYRLTDCPDILPTQWPSPAEFPDATRTYLRLDGPLHTAYALCPDVRGKAEPSPELTGVLVSPGPVRVRLSWSGGGALSVSSVGSASGVAAVVPESAPECDASCVLVVGSASRAILTMQRVDPCPPATTSDRLTLLVTRSSATPVPVAIQVDGLHRAICG